MVNISPVIISSLLLLLNQGCSCARLSSAQANPPRTEPLTLIKEGEYPTNVSQILNQTIENTVTMLKNLEVIYRQTADQIVQDNKKKIREKVAEFRNQIMRQHRIKASSNISGIIASCIEDGDYVEIVEQQVIDELNQCAIVTLMEVVNIISDSINEAQTFMDLPTIIAQDLQTCGLGPECLPVIVKDAFYQSLETPSKVLVLAARVQQFSFHSIGSVTGCAVDAFGRLVNLGGQIVDDVITCMDDKLSH